MTRATTFLVLVVLCTAPLRKIHAQTFTYDAVGRLTLAAYPDGNAVRYAYDEADNLVSVLPVTAPVAPDGVTTTTGGADSINVSWTDNATNESGYIVERRSSENNAWEVVATLSPGVTMYTDTGLNAGTEYSYRISAAGVNADSAYSFVSTSTTEALAAASFTTSLSTRAQVGTGSDLLIPGISIAGTESKKILVRAIGPSLVDFGVNGFLDDPELTVVPLGGSPIASNDNWEDNPNLAELIAAFDSTSAFPLPTGSKDAAVLLDLAPGQYTAVMSGKGGTTGVGLVEVYDVEPDNPNSRFASISGRAQVGAGDGVLIPGFVVSGSVPQTFLIRGTGPSLEQFDVVGVLADPQLTVFKGSQVIATNDNWSDNTNASEVATASAQVFAFPLPNGSLDAALLITLEPALYTVVVSGIGSTSGVALVEVYQVE